MALGALPGLFSCYIKLGDFMKYLHTMIRISNIEASVKFYTEVLGFTVHSQQDYPEGKFTLVFLKSHPEQEEPCLELTYNYGTDSYDIGNGYGHMAFLVPSLDELQKHVESLGYKFSVGPKKTPNGKSGMAFIKDPDGYSVELLSRG